MIERELRMHFIACNIIRSVMQKAALTHDVDIKRLSFKGCLDTVRQLANATSVAEDKPRTFSVIIEEMLRAIATDLPLPSRSKRTPRQKTPSKNYRLLTKPGHKTGSLPHRKAGVEKTPKGGLT